MSTPHSYWDNVQQNHFECLQQMQHRNSNTSENKLEMLGQFDEFQVCKNVQYGCDLTV